MTTKSRIPSVTYDARTTTERVIDNTFDARHGVLLMALSATLSVTFLVTTINWLF